MKITHILTKSFEKFPEWPVKNRMRYFLAFSPLVPKSIQDLSPVKGYELYRKLKEGEVVVDAGAFTGDYTVFAAKKVGKEGKVIAFEPDEKNRIILRRNLRFEKLDNVIIVPKGLWNKKATLNFKSQDGLHSNLYSNEGNSSIDVAPLDYELKRLKINKVDFIKMDIEGAEIEAVKGALKTLKKHKPFVAIASYHIVKGKQTSAFLEKFLSRLGYKVKSDFPKHLTTFAWKKP